MCLSGMSFPAYSAAYIISRDRILQRERKADRSEV